LTNEDDVGVFAQRRTQRFVEAVRVFVHFALVHEAFLALVHEFDRILDRQNVLVTRMVDEVDHRRERGALARTSRAGDEHEAPWERRYLAAHRTPAQTR